jgi:thioredoxin-dependent peroxiredoxin
MTTVTLKGTTIHLSGQLPAIGSQAPDAKLVQADLQNIQLKSLFNQYLILNIFPSIDTGTCATSVRTFNNKAADLPNCKVVNISADLPFAQKRFCGSEGIENVSNLSDFRFKEFGQHYGLFLLNGPLEGLLARAIVVVNPTGKIIYTELVSEIANEPNYDAALASIL